MGQEAQELTTEDLSSIFPPAEHGIYAYYGRIGHGKTYAMTADVLEALNRGQVVYTNYPIDWQGYDERENLLYLLLGVLRMKRKFYVFASDNLRYIEVDDNFQDKFSRLTDCIVAIDEGYVAFDSYEMAKMSLRKRKNILHTRHFDRSIWYTTQRPTNIHAVMRFNTNVFYKCTRMLKWPVAVFRREEYDLSGDDVDESTPLSTKLYRGKLSIFMAYDTKYIRQGQESSQSVSGWIVQPGFGELIGTTFRALARKVVPKRRRGVKSDGATLKSGEREPAGERTDAQASGTLF